jgi:tetratricopeptide (TPR) repeat protein
MNQYSHIISAISSGQLTEALNKVEEQLSSSPHDAELLSISSYLKAAAGHTEDAVELLHRALIHATSPAHTLKYASNLAILLGREERWTEAAQLAEIKLPLPSYLTDQELDPKALENLCSVLLKAGKSEFVALYLEPLLDRPASSYGMEMLWLKAAHAEGLYARVIERVKQPAYRWADCNEPHAFAAISSESINQLDDRYFHYQKFLEKAPPYIAPRADTQVLSVMVISLNPTIDRLSASLRAQHMAVNFPSQLMALRPDRYRFLSIFVGSPPRSCREALLPHERAITLNNVVNGEKLKRGLLNLVEAHQQAFELPVINSAAQAAHCTRLETADLVRSITNLVVPRIMRFRLQAELRNALKSRVRDLFSYPVILRSVGDQQAECMFLVSNDEEFDEALTQQIARGGMDVYVIEYAGRQHRGNMFRRMRAAFVGGVPTLIRADYDSHWIVKGRKTQSIQATYRNDRSFLEDADQVLNDPASLGDSVWSTLNEIGQRIPMDIFGLDFDVDSAGQVIFFEANATMNLLSNAPPEIDYPAAVQDRFLKAVDRLFFARAGVRLQ